jgi:hypothetical protein
VGWFGVFFGIRVDAGGYISSPVVVVAEPAFAADSTATGCLYQWAKFLAHWLLSSPRQSPVMLVTIMVSCCSSRHYQGDRPLASSVDVVAIGELDAAGHTDALEFLLLLTSDVIAAGVQLDQRPIILWIAVNNSSSTSGQMGMKMKMVPNYCNGIISYLKPNGFGDSLGVSPMEIIRRKIQRRQRPHARDDTNKGGNT